MEWTFSTELDYKGETITIYFFQTVKNREIFFKAMPYPKGIISPFTLKYDVNVHEFKIVENNVPHAVKEYELIFSVTILNLDDILDFKDADKIILN
jgi:hypothetical protein